MEDLQVKASIKVGVDSTEAKKDLWQFRDDIESFKKRVKSDEGIKLSSNLAELRLRLKDLRDELKKATTQDQRLTIQTNIENVSKQVTQANRELTNFLRTGDKTQSVLWVNFENVVKSVEKVNDSVKSLWLSAWNLKKVEDKIQDTKKAFDTGKISADEYKKKIEQIGQEATKLASKQSLWGLSELLWNIWVTAWITALSNQVITLAGNLQQARVAFGVMTWWAEQAEVLLTDLAEFAKATPFELVWLRDQAKQLLAFWFTAQEIVPLLDNLGNISAWVGTDKLPRLTYALWQVRAAWKLTGWELRQFTEAWVPLLEELSKITGLSTQEMAGNIWNLSISYEQVQQALWQLTSEWGRFFWLMDAQSQTFQWAVSNLKDSVNILWEEIWSVFLPVLTKLVQWVSAIVNPIVEWAQENPKLSATVFWLVAWIVWLLWVLAWLWAAIPFITTLFWGATIAIWGTTIALWALLWPAALVIWAIAAIIVWWTALGNVIDNMSDSTNKQTKSLSELEDQLKLNQKTQARLKKELENGTITLDQYNDSIQSVKEQQRLLQDEADNTTYSVSELEKKIEDLKNQDLSTEQARNELVRLQEEAQRTRSEVVALIETLNIAFKASKKQSDEARKNTESWKNALVWAGGIAWIDQITLNLEANLLNAQTSLAKLNTNVADNLDDLEKKAKEVTTKPTQTLWSTRWGWGSKAKDESKEREKLAEEEAKRLKEIEDQKEKDREIRHKRATDKYKKAIGERIEAGKNMADEFDRAMKLWEQSIDDLTNKIKTANDEINKLQQAQLTEQEKLAQKYVELEAKATGRVALDEGDDLSKILADYQLILQYTDEAQRNEALRVSWLSDVQKIVEEIQRLQQEQKSKEDEVKELEQQKALEEVILEQFNARREELEKAYTQLVEDETIKRVKLLQIEIDKARELIKLQGQAWTSWFTQQSQLWQSVTNSTTSSAVNNVNVNINGNQSPEAIVNEIKNQLINYSSWNNQ